MGRSGRRKAVDDQLDSSDADSVSTTSTALSDLQPALGTEHVNSQEFVLDKCIDALYEKRGSTREEALTGLVDALESFVLLAFVENKYATLFHQFINSLKKGSSKESCLASRAIGLMAITLGPGSSAHEIMEESLPQLSKAMSGSDASKIASILDSLAVITFVGANDLAETETTLKAIWEVVHPKLSANVGASKKPSPAVLAAAISAWSFLLSTVGGWKINPETWKESITFLSTLLEADDRGVRIAAGEALALCFELKMLNVSSSQDDEFDNSTDRGPKRQLFLYMQSLKAKISDQVYNLSMEAGGKGADKKNLNDQRDLFQRIWDFIKSGDCPEEAVKFSNGHVILRVSSWTELIQLNFLKRFLGRGFLKHAQDNQFLHDVFQFSLDETESLSSKEKKIFRTGEEKGRAQKLNKDRKLAQERKQSILKEQDA